MLNVGGRRVLFAGGKGGVGKTTVASALAVRLAERERVLLVSTDPAHSLGEIFGREIGGEPAGVGERLWALEIDPEAQTDRYLRDVKRTMREFVRPEMYDAIERHVEMTRLSPGAVEAATLDRISEILVEEGGSPGAGEGGDFDRLVFDTAPTGHTLRLLSLPETMTAWMDGLLESRDRSESFGRVLRGIDGESDATSPREAGDARARRIREVLEARRRKFRGARRLLTDPERCGFLIVLNPDRLSLQEGREVRATLERLDMPLLAVIVNKVLPGAAGGSGDGTEFFESRRRQQARHLERIDAAFPDVERVRIPLLPADVDGVEGLREIGRRLRGRDEGRGEGRGEGQGEG